MSAAGLLVAMAVAQLGAESSRPPPDHVPPPAPAVPMHDMPMHDMDALMGMHDDAAFGFLLFDRLEYARGDHGGGWAWHGAFRYGNDENRLLLRSEGARVLAREARAEGHIEALWSRPVAAFWDMHAGLRHDFGPGPDRRWLALGVQGLAPYWFEIDATVYVGERGRTSFAFEAEYEMLLTQRLILQPRLEVILNGRRDAAAEQGAGLADAAFGLRLRYEVRREIAPYVGVERHHRFGGTADLARARGEAAGGWQWVAGLRVWY